MSKTGIEVELIGHDGGAFPIIAKVTNAMKRANIDKSVIEEYKKEATAGDYDNLLRVTMEYVEVV